MNRYHILARALATIGAVAVLGAMYAVVRWHRPWYGLAVMGLAVALCEVVDWLRDRAFETWRKTV